MPLRLGVARFILPFDQHLLNENDNFNNQTDEYCLLMIFETVRLC